MKLFRVRQSGDRLFWERLAAGRYFLLLRNRAQEEKLSFRRNAETLGCREDVWQETAVAPSENPAELRRLLKRAEISAEHLELRLKRARPNVSRSALRVSNPRGRLRLGPWRQPVAGPHQHDIELPAAGVGHQLVQARPASSCSSNAIGVALHDLQAALLGYSFKIVKLGFRVLIASSANSSSRFLNCRTPRAIW